MRVASDTQLLEVAPGDVAAVVLDVVNTGQVIDGVTARVIGMPDETVRSQPVLLPLFPDSSGQLTLSLTVPPTHPAGRHALTVEVMSHGSTQPSEYLDLDLQVAPRPAMTLATKPRVVRARRQARFLLEVANTGNLPLTVTPRAVDTDRAVKASFNPTTVNVAAGAVAAVLLTIRGPRMVFGTELDRNVSVEVAARRADTTVDPDAPAEPDDLRETVVRLRQRPIISRGLLTALILASIVALWAAVFLLGLNKVFAGDPMTKAVPASFFAANAGPATGASSGAAGGAAGGGAAGAAAAGGGPAPAGSLPKNGQVPAGVGGSITGTVTATSDHQPVGRILVQALRQTRTGLVVVSSAATQTDGTYTLAGLFPTQYAVRFSASGYKTVWYPNAPAQTGGQLVTAVAQGTTNGVNAVITGNPATVSGTVDPGNTLTPVVTTVVARALQGTSNAPLATATTKPDGTYTLTNLPAPGTYELSFTATGYQPTTIVDDVDGGQQRLEPTVQLAVGTGQISGAVTDGKVPLGGVTITTTVAGKAETLMTPTTGSVGAFVLPNLPTPATYVITFSRTGYGSQTVVVDLAAGASRTGLAPALHAGTGSVTGILVDGSGKGLGGATVTVGGATSSTGSTPSTSATPGAPTPSGATGGSPPLAGTGVVPTTTTLTNGAVGSFSINGLTAPGSYTLTFTRAGYAPATVPVTLTASGAPPAVRVTLSAQLGSITGQVTETGRGATAGTTITATDGVQNWTSTSTQGGEFIIDSLQPGTYTVTASAPGMQPETALVTVRAGAPSAQSFELAP